MNDRLTLIATAVLVVFFFVGGVLDILDQIISKIVLGLLFFGIIINVLMTKPESEE
jgi:hypothetical protein